MPAQACESQPVEEDWPFRERGLKETGTKMLCLDRIEESFLNIEARHLMNISKCSCIHCMEYSNR